MNSELEAQRIALRATVALLLARSDINLADFDKYIETVIAGLPTSDDPLQGWQLQQQAQRVREEMQGLRGKALDLR